MESLPDDAYIYFFCERWVLEYDVVRLISPDLHGENRATKWAGSGTYEVDPSKGMPVFVLMGGYTEDIDKLEAIYPGGEIVVGQTLAPPVNGPAFVAYFPPDDLGTGLSDLSGPKPSGRTCLRAV